MNLVKVKIIVLVFVVMGILDCQKELINYEAEAISVTTEAKTNLQQKLMAAMKEGGTKVAIPFCKDNALGFTNQLGKKHHLILKRITDKPRNETNFVTDDEAKILAEIRNLKSKEGVFPNRVLSSDKNVTVYIPIIMMGQCLQCHGKANEMTEETKSILRKQYPNDKAIGYELGELRGLFSVTFSK
ncbi:MAG: Tll0287-like domain-containing protein [Leptospira bouyouniensis]|uniref:DUF3365 domain-containing protein n=1 Tax=Leptospira bouyouniensis TaxID=2484911 RepID=A0A7I0HPM0_9LEPT|nr:DUF3365 domain-containing protein [Leptospira bouyouniensis]TGK48080.1 DUF3365 domain-containing protein [Leptospira bouyouniensis]TGL03514.1 DUF3365 domain-containing protein [Leptospira bouyouniensis]TGM80444.1 DUF3365 domain-containing protein [Leptospira bouyouniensis]